MANSEPITNEAGPAPEATPPAPPSLIRQLLQHRLDQLEADIREAEREVARAEEQQAQVIRREAAKKSRLVDRNALIEAEIGVNIARQMVDGKQKLLRAEQRHQQSQETQRQIARYERALAEASELGAWQDTWSRCLPLIERAARSYARSWSAILQARRDWEKPAESMRAALERCGLPPQPMPEADVGKNFQEAWTAATGKVSAEVSRSGQPERDVARYFIGGRVL